MSAAFFCRELSAVSFAIGFSLTPAQALAHEVVEIAWRRGNVAFIRKYLRDLSVGPTSTAQLVNELRIGL